MNTDELIAELSDEAAPAKPMAAPVSLWSTSLVASVIYIAGLLVILGVGENLEAFIMQPFSIIELWLLFSLLASSLWVAICHVYPDQYGNAPLTSAPYIILGLLVFIIGIQIDTFDTAKMIAGMPMHLTCLSCIAGASILPAFLLFLLTQRGASVSPIQSGMMITLAAVSIGCIAIRIHEPSMDMAHMLIAHYLPIFVIAGIGALIGHVTLKWR